jgi:hypothetical protein
MLEERRFRRRLDPTLVTSQSTSLSAYVKPSLAPQGEDHADLKPNGIEKILPIGDLDAAEKELLGAAVKELGPSIEKVSSARPVHRQAN